MKGSDKKLLTLLAFAFIMVLVINFTIADTNNYAPVEKGQCKEIQQTCGTCSFVNLTIIYPNSSIALSNQPMSNRGGGIWSYTFCNTQDLGRYDTPSCGDLNGIFQCTTDGTIWFKVTGNGRDEPEGIVITLFVILFIILLFLLTYLIIYSIGHAVTLDFDIIDAAWNLGGFFALLGLSIAERAYLGNPDVDSFLNWAIGIGAVTNVFLPVIYFILTLTVGSWMSKRVKGVDF